MFRYTAEHIAFLTLWYPKLDGKALTIAFNKKFSLEKTLCAIRNCLKHQGIKSGRPSTFTAGHASWNTGTKGVSKGSATSFKKGAASLRRKAAGIEKIKDGLILVKSMTDQTWTRKHHLVWEENNGPVPKGHYVLFKDRDRTNFEPSNLILVNASERQHLVKLEFEGCLTEYEDTIILIARIQAKAKSRPRHEKI